MSPAGCPKMSATPCNRNADESFPVLRLKSREQKSPTPLLIQDKDVLQPSSELRNRPDGRRTYLAGNDLRATARQIVMGYRLRWAVELFHKSVKHNLSFEEVATHGFDAVISHVHWVYCAYILLHMSPPGLSPGVQSIGDKQRALQQGLADKDKRHILQQLTQIGGVQRYKDELRQALAGT